MSVLDFDDFVRSVETCERCNGYKSYNYYDKHSGCKYGCHKTIEEAFERTDDSHIAELEHMYYDDYEPSIPKKGARAQIFYNTVAKKSDALKNKPLTNTGPSDLNKSQTDWS